MENKELEMIINELQALTKYPNRSAIEVAIKAAYYLGVEDVLKNFKK